MYTKSTPYYMIHLSQELTWTEKNDMRNLIIKWLGLDKLESLIDLRITQLQDGTVDAVINDLDNRYDLRGMESKLDDMDYLTQDLESRGNRWDDMADKVEEGDSDTFLLDKVQSVDDRLTELVAGYKLDVQLVKEEF